MVKVEVKIHAVPSFFNPLLLKTSTSGTTNQESITSRSLFFADSIGMRGIPHWPDASQGPEEMKEAMVIRLSAATMNTGATGQKNKGVAVAGHRGGGPAGRTNDGSRQ